MNKNTPEVIYAKDYQVPVFLIGQVKLHVSLFEEKAVVRAVSTFKRNPKSESSETMLKLVGEELKLLKVLLEGKELSSSDYQLTEEGLEIPAVPNSFELEIQTECEPHLNKSLEGLYKSGAIFCTQCESEGFRKITYFLDRPDVMAIYTTTVEAEKEKYPILLSNGNPIDSGVLANGRHFVTFEDPFPKPSYLFALVAGDLVSVKDEFTTKSGKKVALQICVEKGNETKCDHAMRSLKNAMKWDEDVFGLECDLDSYVVVAVDDFNFGAMENKGLNIFNSQYVLADPKTATDANYQAIEGVIGHEYFHNWTGNRVTCRDWFQITLKEGLTVFRDQEFSSDMGERAVCRIGDVRILRDYQFVEDAGPNAHPIRPASYMEINNFYTPTVYNKGAEVIRMIHTMIGADAFRKGIDKYFELYDGQAVTTEDFVHAMELASGKDLKQFRYWYSQAGTPRVSISMDYDESQKTVTFAVKQRKPKNFENEDYRPFHFPVCIGLIDDSGKSLNLEQKGVKTTKQITTSVLEVNDWQQTFSFEGISSKPVPSFLRNFSAPVALDYNYSTEELSFLFLHDEDLFNRYEAGQRLATRSLESLISSLQLGQAAVIAPEVVDAYGALLLDTEVNHSFKAQAFSLPSLISLVEPMNVCDFDNAFKAREQLAKTIAVEHEPLLLRLYKELHQVGGYEISDEAIGRRSLKNTLLGFLMYLDKPEYSELAKLQFEHADNMTDEIVALSVLSHKEGAYAEDALKAFRDKWQGNMLVMNKWFVAQALTRRPDALERVQALEKDSLFDLKNPNKVRSLLGAFTQNYVRFHDVSGRAYDYIAEKVIEIDVFNPSAASHLAGAFKKFGKLDAERKAKMEVALKKILNKEKLSTHSYEIVSKTLKSGGVAIGASV